MRLINTNTFELVEFSSASIPQYAILSHMWGTEEISFNAYDAEIVAHHTGDNSEGMDKIRSACARAVQDRLDYIWIDTCCIDKSSSAELSESINSMYKWYRKAEICYVHMADVLSSSWSEALTRIEWSRWWSRGWTLQEFLAPEKLLFLDRHWNVMFEFGKTPRNRYQTYDHWGYISHQLKPDNTDIHSQVRGDEPTQIFEVLSRASHIKLGILMGRDRWQDACVAEKMSWAARRTTTRVEDVAYCLLGLFGVNMPLLYGEGENAFIRLQAVIAQDVDDRSIFAWPYSHVVPLKVDWPPSAESFGAFAPDPKVFLGNQTLVRRSRLSWYPDVHYSITNKGVHMSVPTIKLPHTDELCHLLVMDLEDSTFMREDLLVAIYVTQDAKRPSQYSRHSNARDAILIPTHLAKKADVKTIYLTLKFDRAEVLGKLVRSDVLLLISGKPLALVESYPPASPWNVGSDCIQVRCQDMHPRQHSLRDVVIAFKLCASSYATMTLGNIFVVAQLTFARNRHITSKPLPHLKMAMLHQPHDGSFPSLAACILEWKWIESRLSSERHVRLWMNDTPGWPPNSVLECDVRLECDVQLRAERVAFHFRDASSDEFVSE